MRAGAAYCGKLLGRWGADVVKVESPGRASPVEALDRYLNGGKRRVVLDRATPEDRGRLERLVVQSDVLVTDLAPAEIDALKLLDPGGAGAPRVRTSITPFGLSGPYRDWEATASTLLALGGYTWLSGDAGTTPLTVPGNYAYYQAGNYAYVATLAAHLRALREPQAQPVTVEVSVLESLAALHQFTFVMYTYSGRVRSRHGNRWENLHPTNLLPCADGWFAVNVLPQFWEPFTLMLGRPDIATDPRFATNPDRMEHADELDEIIVEAMADRPMERVLREAQETWRVPVGYVASMRHVLDDPHLRERRFWRPAAAGALRTAGSPFRFAGDELPNEAAPAPPGAHSDRVLAALEPRGRAREPRLGAGQATSTPAAHRLLEGVRVVDLTRIWSGPLATRILGDLGAEVIKIEAHHGRGPAVPPAGPGGIYPGGEPGERPWNRQGLFNKLNRNKLSVALDLKHERGRELFLRLVAKSDIVIENFSARAMPALDLGYDRLREANEQIIYLAMPAFGLDGPYRDYVGLGPSIEPLIGLQALMGYSESEPRVTSLAITDAISGTTAAVAALTALERRARTGEGAFIDFSQEEAGIAFLGEHLIEYQLEGHEPERWANAHPRFAPHGVYRCRGHDHWIAIAATTEEQWLSLCDVAGRGWADDARFGSLVSRRDHRAALDEAIESWTVGHDKFELMQRLQSARIPAGAVLSAPEVLADPHLDERGFFVELEESDAGRQRYDGSPLLIDGERGHAEWAPSPRLGEHHTTVLGGLLGLSDGEISELYEHGVTADRPPA